jgi:hypothetical protein
MPAKPIYGVEVSWASKLMGNSYKENVKASAPILYFMLDEASGNLVDAMSSGRTSTPVNWTYRQSGGGSGALTGDSANYYVALGQTAGSFGRAPFTGFSFPSNEITFECFCWVPSAPSIPNTYYAFSNSVSAGKSAFLAGIRSTTGNVGHVYVGGGANLAGAAGSFPLAQWVHLVVTMNGGTGFTEAWINGTLAASNTIVNGYQVTEFGSSWAIGQPTGANQPIQFIDEFAVYDRILPEEEIDRHYASRVNGTLSADSWTDLTPYVRETITIRRGRDMEMGKPEPGRASIVLDNKDRRFEPDYASGPYYPNIRPRRKMRIKATWPPYTNLVSNGDFTVNTTGWVNGNTGSISRDATGGPDANDPKARIFFNAASDYVYTLVNLVSGTTYTVTFWAARNESGATINVLVRNAADSANQASFVLPTTQPGWIRHSFTFTANSTGSCRLAFQRSTGGGATNINVDKVMVDASGSTRDYVEGAATTYILFTGYVEDWVQEAVGVTQGHARVDLVDGFGLLSENELGERYFDQQLISQRIDRLLSIQGWSTSARNIRAAFNSAAPEEVQGGSIGDYVLTLAAMDWGLFFIAGDNTATFQDALYRSAVTRSSVPRLSLVDVENASPNYITYQELSWNSGASMIYNDVQITRPGGDPQAATDSTSMQEYGRKSFHVTEPHVTDGTALTRATDIMVGYRNPRIRFKTIVWSPEGQANLTTQLAAYARALDTELSDMYWVSRTPQGTGTAIERNVRVESIELAIDTARNELVVTWGLSTV